MNAKVKNINAKLHSIQCGKYSEVCPKCFFLKKSLKQDSLALFKSLTSLNVVSFGLPVININLIQKFSCFNHNYDHIYVITDICFCHI